MPRASLQPLSSSPPAWSRGSSWDLWWISAVRGILAHGWVGISDPHFAAYFKLFMGSQQHQICPGPRLDVSGFGVTATLSHPSHALNFPGAQSLHCWVSPSGLVRHDLVEMPLQSVMPFSIRRGNWREFPLCSFTTVYLFTDLKHSRAV